MPIVRRTDCVPLPIVVCPVVAVVMLESCVARCVTGLEVPRTGHFTFIVYRFNEEDSCMMGDKKNIQFLLMKTPNSLKFQALLMYTTEGLSI